MLPGAPAMNAKFNYWHLLADICFKMDKLRNFYALFWILGLTLLIYAFFRIKQVIFQHKQQPATTTKPSSR
jgi:hypothetical protein